MLLTSYLTRELSDSDDEDYQQLLQDAINMLKNLTQRRRQDIYEDLLQLSTNGTLQRNSTTLIAAKYHVHVRTIRVWQRAKNCLAQGIPVDVKSLRPKNCGRKKIQVDLTRVVDPQGTLHPQLTNEPASHICPLPPVIQLSKDCLQHKKTGSVSSIKRQKPRHAYKLTSVMHTI